MHKLCILSVLLLLIYNTTIAQKKYAQWDYSVTDTVTPKLMTVNEFLPFLFNQSFYSDCKCFNNIDETGRDSNYVYFLKYTKKGDYKYKVPLTEWNTLGNDNWDVCQIMHRFFNKFVPEKDRNRTPNFFCNTTPSIGKFTCRYIASTNAIEISLEWKIYCEILIKLVNERYTGIYSFENNSFLEAD